ncbi:MAG: sigma-70 family RNA polymerase sigma factor [Acidimicrobiia bacterium]|nr:sigma-70 family RNA polymerase sigma factor [Acidimicrobiia bacterium]
MTAIGQDFPQVLAAAQEGAEWAWSQLYHSVANQLASFARVKGAPEPEDVVGEVFHDVARNITSFEGTESNFRSWVFGIAHNRLVDQWRKGSRSKDEPNQPIDTTKSAESAALDAAVDSPAFRALDGLTEQQRNVMVLRTVADLSLNEVAEALELKPNAVKALQHRAVKQLRKALGKAVTK